VCVQMGESKNTLRKYGPFLLLSRHNKNSTVKVITIMCMMNTISLSRQPFFFKPKYARVIAPKMPWCGNLIALSVPIRSWPWIGILLLNCQKIQGFHFSRWSHLTESKQFFHFDNCFWSCRRNKKVWNDTRYLNLFALDSSLAFFERLRRCDQNLGTNYFT
jgi:hypothetical protein